MSVLQCPQCGSRELVENPERLECEGCGQGFPVIMGEVIDFAPGPGFRDTWSYSFTYSYSSRLYELWRTSRLMKLSCGVSYQEERERVLSRMELGDGLCILDVGCGTGIFSREFAKHSESMDVWGLDYSYRQLCQALVYKKREGTKNLRFAHGRAEELPFADESFQRVCTVGAMHFFDPARSFFHEVYRVLMPGGIFVGSSFLSINAKPSDSWYTRLIQKRAHDTGVHFFSRQEVVELAHESGFKDVDYFEKEIFFVLKARK